LTLAGFVDEGFRRRLSVSGTARTGMGDAIAAILKPSAPGGSSLDGPGVDLTDPSLWASQLQVSVVPLDLSIEDLATFIDLPPGLSGGLSGGFQLTGDPSTPAVSGALQLTNGQLGAVSVQSGLLVLMPAEGGYHLSLDLGMLDAEAVNHELHVAGFVPVAVGGETPSTDAVAGMDLRVNGALPLGLLRGVVRGVADPAGALMLDARITGRPRTPVVQAELSLADGALTYEPLGLVYDDLNLKLRVAGDQLFVDHLEMSNHKRFGLLGGRSGRSGRSGRRLRTLSGTGHAVLDGWGPASVDATLNLDGFWLIADQDHELALSGDLTMSGAWPSPLVSGALAVDTSQIIFGEDAFAGDRSLAIDHSLTIKRSKATSVAQPHVVRGPALWRRFSIDVDLDLLRNLRLRATVPLQSDYGQQFAQLSSVGLDTELGGKLRLTQQDQKLALQGSIETLRGTATVLGVPFDIRDGTISFLGDGVDNPLVDVAAVRHTGSYGDVNVKLSGFVDSLKIDPSSEDYPDKTDVVTLLLFGKPASEMGDTEGAAGAQVVAATLSALTGSVEQALGASVFDELEIDPSAVRVGWALSDRLFLRLQRRFEDNGTDNQTQVTLEYLISRRLYAEFTTGDRAVSSASLYWRWRF
ncbi:MAG: hypothetical protein GXP62_03445, partial [Oligoflexia bacterium]|nr:hypothetical protein [Oligoflexia bacterium]